MMRTLPIELPEAEIQAFCRKYGVTSFALFGSVLRDDFTSSSDIDVLVEFEPERIPGLIRLGMMEEELSALFARKVDLNTSGLLSPYFKDEVLRDAERVYVAA
jgi:uncharacterized protein